MWKYSNNKRTEFKVLERNQTMHRSTQSVALSSNPQTLQNVLSNEALGFLQESSPRRSGSLQSAPSMVFSSSTASSANSGGRAGTNEDRNGNLPESTAALVQAEREIVDGYETLREQARKLLGQTRRAGDLGLQRYITPSKDPVRDLEELADGRISSAMSVVPPCSVRISIRAMEAQPTNALNILVDDLILTAHWWLSQTEPDIIPLQQAIEKRIRVFKALLPKEFQEHIPIARMHFDHEELGRGYVNKETMDKRPVAAISRESFWRSEDGYAWDMSELAKALVRNGEDMRNPLSRKMFTPRDVESIVTHPKALDLATMRKSNRNHWSEIIPRQSTG